MKRREFLFTGAASLTWLHCGGGDPRPAQPDAVASACDLTGGNAEGPFYSEGAPSRMDLVTEETTGTLLSMTGGVIAFGTCDEIAGAELDFWQADTNGAYDNVGFELRGVMTANDSGLWELRTIIPGNYMDGGETRPAHIHVKVRAPGFRTLTTQLYFEGDPFNETDRIILDSLIMPVADNPDGSKSTNFEFVLAPE